MIQAISISTVEEDGLFYATMLEEDHEVCQACYMRDKTDRVVVIQLDTPVEYRGNGYARSLLDSIQRQEETSIRVISTDHTVNYYKKLGYTQVSEYIFQHQ